MITIIHLKEKEKEKNRRQGNKIPDKNKYLEGLGIVKNRQGL